MPLGKWKDFGSCVSAQRRSGHSEESSKKICGSIENSVRNASTNIKYEEGDRFYIKAFLMDASLNINRWGINPDSLDRNINTFIGKPLVLTESFSHPMPPDFDRVANESELYDDDDNPHNVVKVNDIVSHWLAYQEDYRVGNIIDITDKNGIYYAIIEITDPQAKEAFRNNDVPLFVSPAIAQLDIYENPSNISNWTGIHLAIVSNPAYTIKKALVTGQCHESGDNKNDTGRCLLQLRQASVLNKDSNKETLFGCGFCRGRVLARYAEVVQEWGIKSQTTDLQSDFIDSSRKFSESQNKVSELTDLVQQEKESNNNNDNNNTNKEIKTKETILKEHSSNIPPKDPKDTEPKGEGNKRRINPDTGQPYAASEFNADELGIKVAGMEECVQIFTQNGVTPDQSVQICKLAAKALMENQQGQQPPGGAGGGKTQGNGPGISGQFGSSIADYEKEIARQEVKIGQLVEELKNYKKGDKTDAQRIAELEETVTKLNSNLKEKELEAYLVTKISDTELRNKKIKRFAELNMSIEDLKDIYDDNANTDPKVATNNNNNNVKKVANVQQESSPISKVKLQVASTANNSSDQQQEEVNEIRERNNRISSLLSRKEFK